MAKHKVSVEKEVNISPKELSTNFLYILAFVEGSIVIFLELLGSKLIQAFYGNSLLVWSIVICVTISSLTLGYFLGGKFSKSENKIKVLAILFSLAAFFTCIMPVWIMTLLEKYSESDLASATIATSILLLAPGIITLGATTPIIIQLLSEKNNEAGKASGNTYAISTVAGIITTFILGFFVMPIIGTKTPLILAAYLLILFSIIIRFTKIWVFSIFLLLLITFSFFKEKDSDSLMQTIYNSEGLMGQLKVVDQSYVGNDTKFRLLVINGIPQTIVYNGKNPGKSFWEYAHRISAAASLKKDGDALLFGMGGGAIANELQKLNFKLDIVDIDQRMYQIAQNYFYFTPKKSTTFTVDDARHYIKTHTKKYDFIMLDICTGEVQPSNVFTKEGIKELKGLLKKDGFIIIQYQEKSESNTVSGSKSIAKTFASNGLKAYENVEKGQVNSILIACAYEKIKFNKINVSKLTENAKASKETTAFLNNPFQVITYNNSNSIILTDDKPLLEKINAHTIEEWRKIMIKNYGLKVF